MKTKRFKFYNPDDDSVKIPAFVTRIDKSAALRRFQRLAETTPPEWSYVSPYFEKHSNQHTTKSIKSTLLEYESLEYGYRIKDNTNN